MLRRACSHLRLVSLAPLLPDTRCTAARATAHRPSPTSRRSSIDESVVAHSVSRCRPLASSMGLFPPSRPFPHRSPSVSRPKEHPVSGFRGAAVANNTRPGAVCPMESFAERRSTQRAFVGFSTSKSASRPTPEGACLALLGRATGRSECRDGLMHSPCQLSRHGRTPLFLQMTGT